ATYPQVLAMFQELRQRYVTACIHVSPPNEGSRGKTNEALDVKHRTQHHSLLETAGNLRRECVKGYPTSDSAKNQRPVTGFLRREISPSPQSGVTCATGTQRTNPRLTQFSTRAQLSVPKFYCDIEAALAGELSDSQEDHEGTNNVRNKNANNCRKSRSKNHLRKDATVPSSPEWHPETRIIRYPSLAPLPINVLHKVYVVYLEDQFAWVRLLNGKRPICFHATDESIKDEHPLSLEDIIPSAPCAVFASFKPLDIINDSVIREPIEIKCYARGVVEKIFKDRSKATVRLVDFGFCLTSVDFLDIKPLAIVHDGPPLALRLHIDSLNEVCQYFDL
uniref:Tudor domain-containing protein n=1 Tax=Parascaris univalens TaxID=6257 RepID=A0A914ZZC9_PARUN